MISLGGCTSFNPQTASNQSISTKNRTLANINEYDNEGIHNFLVNFTKSCSLRIDNELLPLTAFDFHSVESGHKPIGRIAGREFGADLKAPVYSHKHELIVDVGLTFADTNPLARLSLTVNALDSVFNKIFGPLRTSYDDSVAVSLEDFFEGGRSYTLISKVERDSGKTLVKLECGLNL